MYKVACTKKELSCLLSNLFQELLPVCGGGCSDPSPDGDLVISGIITGTTKIAVIKVTEYGCEYYGDINVLNTIREKRCLHATPAITEES